MESGLYVTFFNRDEAHDRELPPVGPLDRVVLRHKQLVAERSTVQQAQELGVAIDRWLEAELELQRATGEEPGGTKRPDLRVAARDGVFVRFAVFGEARERDLVPEVGPFAVVVVGPRTVEGDGQLLATRAASELAAWEITNGVSNEHSGLHKPDVAFRATSGVFHESIAVASAARAPLVEPPRRAEPAFVPPPRIEPEMVPPPRIQAPPVEREPLFKPREAEPLFKPREERPSFTPPSFTPPAEEPSALTAQDLELIQRIERDRAEDTLRARVQEEERRRLGVDETTDDEATTWAMRYRPQAAGGEGETSGEGAPAGSLLWRMRFVLIGILLVSVGLYTFTAVRTGTAAGVNSVQQQFNTVGVGTKVTGTRWEWVVNGVQRASDAGTAHAAGVFYIVRVGATNKGTDGAQLSPSEFTLIDANGIEHAASSLGSGVYQGQGNPGSPNVWPQGFAVGKTTNFNVVFDIDPALGRGMKLGVTDLPKTRIALD
jgi:uncharacterized protein DUF4352